MEKLYVIYDARVELDGRVALIDEVEVVRETPKRLTVKHPNIYRTSVNKSELNCILGNNYLFTYDLTRGTKIWNDHFDGLAESYRTRARECDDLIL